MLAATEDEIAELLGDRADETIVERIANLDPTVDEVSEAIEDLDYQTRFGEERIAASPKVEEIRRILEELPVEDVLSAPAAEEDELEGLSVREPDELGTPP